MFQMDSAIPLHFKIHEKGTKKKIDKQCEGFICFKRRKKQFQCRLGFTVINLSQPFSNSPSLPHFLLFQVSNSQSINCNTPPKKKKSNRKDVMTILATFFPFFHSLQCYLGFEGDKILNINSCFMLSVSPSFPHHIPHNQVS